MHFKGLDLNLLVILDALLQEKGVTKAAVKLHVSQPAISAALAKLREHTGDELLQKVGREFRLTPRAKMMVEPVREILLQVESTIYPSADFDPSKSERRFEMAMTSYAAEVLSPKITNALAHKYPNITVSFEDMQADSLERLRQGRVDFCVTFHQTKFLGPSESLDGLQYGRVFTDEWVLIAAHDNPSVYEGMSYEEFCRLAYIETCMGRDLRSNADRTLDNFANRPRPVVRVPSFELAVTNVFNSECVTVAPKNIIDKSLRPLVKTVSLPFEMPPIEEFLVWHERNDDEPGHMWFRSLVMGFGQISNQD